MVPYRGRLSLQIARVVLALAGLAWHEIQGRAHLDGTTGLLAAYVVFSLYSLPEKRWTRWSDVGTLFADTAYFALWSRITPISWMPVASLSYLLASLVILHKASRTFAIVALALFLALLLPFRLSPQLAWTTAAFGGLAISAALYKDYLNRRISGVLRQNMAVRSQSEAARDEERERIAADFHDGPLQHFISFHMRLEVIKKLLGRGDTEGAKEEVRQLQDLCRNQVADLRSFARSMRPVEEHADFEESLTRMVNVFERDTGIESTVSTHGTETMSTAPDLLQIVREALHNIHKHAGASRVAVSAAPQGRNLQITVEDNGTGFPFSGKYDLEELERLRLGPISIKRRVRLLNGGLVIESYPDHGSKLEIQVPL